MKTHYLSAVLGLLIVSTDVSAGSSFLNNLGKALLTTYHKLNNCGYKDLVPPLSSIIFNSSV